MAGDGMLTFDDHVQTVGDLRAAIEETTKIPGIKQVLYIASVVVAVSAAAAAALAAAAAAIEKTGIYYTQQHSST